MPVSHKRHEIDHERLKEVYAEASEVHDYKKSLCDVLVKRLVEQGRAWGDHR